MRNRQLALEAARTLLTEPGAQLTVEAIAKQAGLGVGTIVRAFGGKEALLDAAASGLLEPVVARGWDLLRQTSAERALRTFLGELIAFQSAHHAISDVLGGLDLPATTAIRADLVHVVQEMITRARTDGTIRTDIDPGVMTTLISESTYAISRVQPASRKLTRAFLTVLLDGLRSP